MMAAITSAIRTSQRGSRRIRLTAANRAGASRMMTAMLVISQSSGVLRSYDAAAPGDVVARSTAR